MEKLINFVKSHPALTAVVAIGVLLLFFWPSSGGGSSGASDAAMAANAVANSQAASAQMQLSADQVRIAGINAATAQAIKASDNAAAVSIATLENQTNREAIQAELAGLQSSNATEKSLAQYTAASQAIGAISQILPVTQAQANAAGQQTDAAGSMLGEMFRNLLNSFNGIASSNTIISSNKNGTIATVFGADGRAIDSQLIQLPANASPTPVSKTQSVVSNWRKENEDRYSRENSDSSSSKSKW